MRSRASLLSLVVAATVLIPGPATAQDASPATGTDPAVLVGTTRSGVARLVRIPLDGRNIPQILVERPAGDSQDAPGWSVSPDGRSALFVSDVDTIITVIDLATGAARDVAMAGPIDGYDLQPVWSGDSSHVAIADGGWSVVDLVAGTRTHVRTDSEAYGFDASGRLILAREVEGGLPGATWTFERWDPATPETQPLAIPIDEAAVSLAAPSTVSVPLRASVEEVNPTQDRSGMGLRTIEDGSVQRFADLPSESGTGTFDPTGRLAVLRVRDQLSLGTPDLATVPLLAVDDGDLGYVDPRDVRFSPGSGLLAFQRGYRDPVATVHEVASGRTIFVPLPADVATATLVGVTGTRSLPLLPIARPDEWVRPTEATTGTVIAGSPLVVSSRIDRPVGGPARLSVAFGRPATGGVVRTRDKHDFPVPSDAEDRPMDADLIPGPGPDTVTVTTGWGDERRAWTWTLGKQPRPMDLPKPFRRAIAMVWSPDGSTLAGRLRYTDEVVSLWRPADGTSWFIAVPTRYQGGWIERFTSDGRALVVSPPVCSDVCDPPFPDHDLALPLDGGPGRPIRASGWYAWDSDGSRLEIRDWSAAADPVTIRLPVGMTTARSYAATAQIQGPDLWVFATRGSKRSLLHYDRPWLGVRAPARLALPDEVQAISRLRPGWVQLVGESTLACPARQAVARPGAGVFWVGACRDIAFTLP